MRTERRRTFASWNSGPRWVVVQGADRRYYVYAGSVGGGTPGPLENAVVTYVFAKSSAAWRDEAGNWLASIDTAIS